jgi:rubredoxin
MHPLNDNRREPFTCPECKANTIAEPRIQILTCRMCRHVWQVRTGKPAFGVGDRFFTHYDMKWGTVQRIGRTDRGRTHGVTRNPLPDTTWYDVRYDKGGTSLLDDAHGDWEQARMVPPDIAKAYGYGSDPKAKSA